MWVTSRDLRPCEGTDKRKQGKCTSFVFWGLQERHELRRGWSWDEWMTRAKKEVECFGNSAYSVACCLPEVACLWGFVYFTFQPCCPPKSLREWSWCLTSSFGVCAKMAASSCWYYCPCPWEIKTGLGDIIHKGRRLMTQEPHGVEKRGTIWKQAWDPVLQFEPDHLGVGKIKTQIQTFCFQVYIFILIRCSLNE